MTMIYDAQCHVCIRIYSSPLTPPPEYALDGVGPVGGGGGGGGGGGVGVHRSTLFAHMIGGERVQQVPSSHLLHTGTRGT